MPISKRANSFSARSVRGISALLFISITLSGCSNLWGTPRPTTTIAPQWATITGSGGPQSVIDKWADALVAEDYDTVKTLMAGDNKAFERWKTEMQQYRQRYGSLTRHGMLEGPAATDNGYRAVVLWHWESGREFCHRVLITSDNKIIVLEFIDC